jgi:hypothetical protein
MNKIKRITALAAAFGIMGVVALPAASYAVQKSDTVDVEVIIDEALSISCVGDYSHDFMAAGDKTNSTGDASEDDHGKCTVITNSATGYTLTLADTDADTNLVSTSVPTNTIPAKATHSAGDPGWAVNYSTTAGSTTLDKGRTAVPPSTSPLTIANKATASASAGDVYEYGFSSSISSITPAGTYQDEVTFTVATNVVP